MIGKREGAVILLQKHLEGLDRNGKITSIHCLIHQEVLCAKISIFKSVMHTVVKAVTVILSHGTNHHQFRQFLLEAENEYDDLLFFSRFSDILFRKSILVV